MQKKIAVTAGAFLFFVELVYVWRIVAGAIQPVFASWLLFFVGVMLSFWTYWSSKEHSITGNVSNAVDVVGVFVILLAILAFGNDVRFDFNTFEIRCLVASGAILVFWRITKRHVLSNLAVQVFMTVAYFPMLHELWYASRNTDSLAIWIFIWLANIPTLIAAILKRDKLGIVYASRAFVLSLFVVAFMIRIAVRASGWSAFVVSFLSR